jgi:hypothetical protein
MDVLAMIRQSLLIALLLGTGLPAWAQQPGGRALRPTRPPASTAQPAGMRSELPQPSRARARQVAYQQSVLDGEPIMVDEGFSQAPTSGEVFYEGGYEYDGGMLPEQFEFSHGSYLPGPTGSVASCGPEGCGDWGDSRQICICLPSHGWVQLDYLLWHQSAMRTPGLLSTATPGTSSATAGVLGQSSTSLLHSDRLLDGQRDGGRIRFGWWMANHPNFGLEGEYFGLGGGADRLELQSVGNPIIARPFFNMLTGAEDSQLIAFPNVVSGSVSMQADSRLDGAAFRFRHAICSQLGCGGWLDCGTMPSQSRFDVTLGYRFYQLAESIGVVEQVQANGSGSSVRIEDQFQVRNQFNGVELGTSWHGRRGYWTADLLMRVAIGNNYQTVLISGQTDIITATTIERFDNGFLAQRTNAGTHQRNRFSAIPELGGTIGYQLTRGIRLHAGYNMLFLAGMVRPGEHIDMDLNPNLLAPEADPFSGPARPRFRFQETNMVVQGLTLGGEFRW